MILRTKNYDSSFNTTLEIRFFAQRGVANLENKHCVRTKAEIYQI